MATLEELEAELARRQAASKPSLQELEAEAQRRASMQQASEQDITLSDLGKASGGLGLEAVTGVNRSIARLLDFFTIDQINNVRSLLGEDAIPTLEQALISPRGQFTEGTIAEGLPTDVAANLGEVAVAGLTGQGIIQQGARQLAPLATTTGARVLKQAAQPSLVSAGGFGAASGVGEEVGREIGDEEGALVGAIAAPIAGIAALGGAKAVVTKLASKFGKNIGLIDQQTALPTPAFQKALDKRGVQYGSIIDDVERLPVLQGRQNADDVVDKILRRKLITGATDDVTATLRLEGNKIVPDKLGEEAIKQGFKAGNVAAVKGMNQSTKKEALKMLNMTRQIKSNASKADDFRPTDIVGDNVMQRFKFIRGKADSLRNELDNIANKPKPSDSALGGPDVTQGLRGQQINAAPVEDGVITGLQKLNMDIPEEVLADTRLLPELLKGKGSFIGSDISKDRTSQRIIKDVVDLLGEGGSDAFRAHKLKRQLDNLIDFNKKSAQGLTKAGKDFAKAIRFELNNAIREVNPQYAKINDELSASIKAMDDFQKVLGPSIDVFDRGASAAVGQDLRGLLSNRKTRIRLDNAINKMDETAKQLGGSFDVNVKNLARFANTLDDRFGAVAETSLKGEVESVVREGARATAVKKVAEQAEKLRGINDKNALNAIQKILKR